MIKSRMGRQGMQHALGRRGMHIRILVGKSEGKIPQKNIICKWEDNI
jgi:hypothetical protein